MRPLRRSAPPQRQLRPAAESSSTRSQLLIAPRPACPGLTEVSSVIGDGGFTTADYEKETFLLHRTCPHRTAVGHWTVNCTECHPVAPSGMGATRSGVWVYP